MLRYYADHSRIKTELFKGLRFLHNPPEYTNPHFGLNAKLYVFEAAGGKIYIDFMEHDVKPNAVYMVPPLHFVQLSRQAKRNFICIDLGNTSICTYHRQLLCLMSYQSIKSWPLPSKNVTAYQMLFEQMNLGLSADALVSTVFLWVESAVPQWMRDLALQDRQVYLRLAERFLGELSAMELSTENCIPAEMSLRLGCDERKLQRSCKIIFDARAGEILHYHLAVKAIYLLSNRRLEIGEILEQLCFSSSSTFSRFLKRIVGKSPAALRAHLRREKLD